MMGLSFARPIRPKAAVTVKPSLPTNELACPDPKSFDAKIFRTVVSSACNLFIVTLTSGSDIGHGLKSRDTPMTTNCLEGGGDFSIDINQPVQEVRHIHAFLPDSAVDARSTHMTSSTQLLAGTAQSIARISVVHSGYLLKLSGALLPPNS